MNHGLSDLTPYALWRGLFSSLIASAQADPVLGLSKGEQNHLEKDLELALKRSEDEGFSFVTKTLPSFAKAVERSIEEGPQYYATAFANWRPYVCHSLRSRDLGDELVTEFLGTDLRIPTFLRTLVVPALLGNERPQCISAAKSARCLLYTRQLCYLMYKLEMEPTEADSLAVISSFVETEVFLQDGAKTIDSDRSFDRAYHIFQSVCKSINFQKIVGRHGPGGVATGEKGRQKWTFKRIYGSVNRVYPAYEYYAHWGVHSVCPKYPFTYSEESGYARDDHAKLPTRRFHLLQNAGLYKQMERVPFPTARVELVPKDSRGPRVISLEPLELQFLQQGLMTTMIKAIESHPLTAGQVNFRDQSINGELALVNSKTRDYATLDLKDASDRVSCTLVKALAGPYWKYFEALRSHQTRLPSGKMLPLEKFAPMGSALCFPVLALVVFALVQPCCEDLGVDGDVGKCFVFGDDLVVPTGAFSRVVEALESANLMVNVGKSFAKSYFRESCGVDAFRGVNVTPTKIRKFPPDTIKSVQALEAWISYSNQFYSNCMDEAADLCRKVVEDITGPLPDWDSERVPFLHFERMYKALNGALIQHHGGSMNSMSRVWVRCPLSKDDPMPEGPRLYNSLTQRIGKEFDPAQSPTGGMVLKRKHDVPVMDVSLSEVILLQV